MRHPCFGAPLIGNIVIPLKIMKYCVKILWSVIFLIVFMFSNTKGENISKSFEDSVSQRKYFMTFTIGVVEYSSLCFSYQIDSEYSIGVKFQNILIESGGGGGATGFVVSGAFGIGIVGAHYFSGRLFNSVKLSLIPLWSSSYSDDPNSIFNGVSFECTFNRERLLSGLFKFYYELGGAVIKYSERKALIAPSIKIGIIYNF